MVLKNGDEQIPCSSPLKESTNSTNPRQGSAGFSVCGFILDALLDEVSFLMVGRKITPTGATMYMKWAKIVIIAAICPFTPLPFKVSQKNFTNPSVQSVLGHDGGSFGSFGSFHISGKIHQNFCLMSKMENFHDPCHGYLYNTRSCWSACFLTNVPNSFLYHGQLVKWDQLAHHQMFWTQPVLEMLGTRFSV